jgi:hypothetical protein
MLTNCSARISSFSFSRSLSLCIIDIQYKWAQLDAVNIIHW